MIEGLKDKVVIVTGGGHGIGRAYCHGFGEAGANVVVADIDAPAAEKVAGEVNPAVRRQGLGRESRCRQRSSRPKTWPSSPSTNSAASTF